MKREEAETTICEALSALEDYLPSSTIPESGPLSVSQLLFFREQLKEMLRSIHENLYITAHKGTMGRLITDSWPLDSTLGEKIIRAEQKYREYHESITKNTS
ncbi:MAG: hypothetical protein ROW48_13750 [Bellilinea sp.]|jgi:hypothetical protein